MHTMAQSRDNRFQIELHFTVHIDTLQFEFRTNVAATRTTSFSNWSCFCAIGENAFNIPFSICRFHLESNFNKLMATNFLVISLQASTLWAQSFGNTFRLKKMHFVSKRKWKCFLSVKFHFMRLIFWCHVKSHRQIF